MHYLSELFVMICHGGRLLSGRPDIRRAYEESKLIFLNKENEEQVQSFLFHVLHLQCWPEKLNPDRGKEKKITQTLFASFLLWLDSVSSTI